MKTETMTDQQIIEMLAEFDDTYDGTVSKFEIGFLETMVKLFKSKRFYLSSGQRENGIRILEKYEVL